MAWAWLAWLVRCPGGGGGFGNEICFVRKRDFPCPLGWCGSTLLDIASFAR